LKNKPIINAIAPTAKDSAFDDTVIPDRFLLDLLGFLYVIEIFFISHLIQFKFNIVLSKTMPLTSILNTLSKLK